MQAHLDGKVEITKTSPETNAAQKIVNELRATEYAWPPADGKEDTHSLLIGYGNRALERASEALAKLRAEDFKNGALFPDTSAYGGDIRNLLDDLDAKNKEIADLRAHVSNLIEIGQEFAPWLENLYVKPWEKR